MYKGQEGVKRNQRFTVSGKPRKKGQKKGNQNQKARGKLPGRELRGQKISTKFEGNGDKKGG